MKDSYRNIAGIYDRIFDSMNKGLRLVGIRMFRPKAGMSILDVGCGTGSHLELYQRYPCDLYGVDTSASMLAVAGKRLGQTAQLEHADASNMPYQDGKFDFVICMLSLHEMPAETRSIVLEEMKRVLKNDGRMLLIDFEPGPVQFHQGWLSRVIIFTSELAAGSTHFSNYRDFMASGGLSSLASKHDLDIEKRQILAGGTFAVCLLKPIKTIKDHSP